MIAIGLGEAEIKQQSLEELQQSFERVNDALNNADSFGTIAISFAGESGAIIVQDKGKDSVINIGIVPILLERKKLILDRIALLKEKRKIEGLEDLVNEVSDDDVRTKLQAQLAELQSDSKKIDEQLQEVEQQQVEVREKELQELTDLDLKAKEAEIFETKSRAWQNIIQRESVVTIVGSILLVGLLTKMFT